MKFNRRLIAASIAGLAFAVPLVGFAQAAYPTKPIKVIVPFAAGSTTDIIARAIADKMSQSMGQPGSAEAVNTSSRHRQPVTRRR